jgi:hypothetical protein
VADEAVAPVDGGAAGRSRGAGAHPARDPPCRRGGGRGRPQSGRGRPHPAGRGAVPRRHRRRARYHRRVRPGRLPLPAGPHPRPGRRPPLIFIA